MYKEINRIIEVYRATDNTDYAIALNGEWGCGKTYYVEHALREAVEATGGHILYASLHGARDYDQVATQLTLSNIAHALKCNVEAIHGEYWCGKVLQVFKDSDSTCSRILGLTVQHWLDRKKNISYKIDKDSTLVVIDDIERAANDRVRREILGSIYEEYIRRGYHVLLIGDETKIDPRSAYFECKEKYVRRTINVNAWQSDLVFDFAKERCKRLNWLYEAIKYQLGEFVASKKVANLRVVAMIIDTIAEIVAGIEEGVAKKYAKFIFSATAPLVHAMSRGLIVPDDLEGFAGLTKLQTIKHYYYDKSKRENLDLGMQKACRFFDEYCRDVEEDIVLIKSIFRYVLTGYLDCKAIQAEILDIFEKAELPERIAFKKLGDFWIAEESEISDGVRDIFGFLEEGKYSFDDIISIYKGLSVIRDRKYISVWPYEDDLRERFINYIRRRSKFEQPPSQEDDFRRHICEDRDSNNPGISCLYDEIDTIYKSHKMVADKNRIDNLFAALRRRDRTAAYDILSSANGQCKIFSDIVKYGKVEEIVALPVMGIRFLESQARAQILDIVNSAEYERDQIPAINTIASFLENYASTGKDSISRKERMSELARVLRSSVKYMEDYIAQQTSHNAR